MERSTLAEIVVGWPPIKDRILEAFPAVRARRGVIFSWGSIIYNPHNVAIPPALRAHEAVHEVQQNGDPLAWWERYIADPAFRYEQELLAHRAEWRAQPNRAARRAGLVEIARRLSSPMYGGLITFDQAKAAISA